MQKRFHTCPTFIDPMHVLCGRTGFEPDIIFSTVCYHHVKPHFIMKTNRKISIWDKKICRSVSVNSKDKIMHYFNFAHNEMWWTSSICRQTIFGALFYLMMILMIILSGLYEIFQKHRRWKSAAISKLALSLYTLTRSCTDCTLELRQYKNDSIQWKIIPILKFPLFFPYCIG